MSDDILCKLANLIRFGTVQAVAGKRVRVKIGGLLTRPIAWVSTRAGKTKSWSPPDIGEQVAIASVFDQLVAQATPHSQGSMDSTAIGRLLAGEIIAE